MGFINSNFDDLGDKRRRFYNHRIGISKPMAFPLIVVLNAAILGFIIFLAVLIA